MTATRKQGKCKTCGTPLRCYIDRDSDSGEITHKAAACPKCTTVLTRGEITTVCKDVELTEAIKKKLPGYKPALIVKAVEK